jgi:N-acetylmuramoyl-L-alanine amidase
MPSILTEIGFISNKEEEKYLVSDKGQQELTKAIFNAFSKQVEDGKSTKNTDAKNTETKTIEVKTTETKDTEPKITEIKDTVAKTTVIVPAKDTSNLQSGVLYKVQFLFTAKEYPLTDPLFKNMQDISVEKVGNAYKYSSGRCPTFAEASALLAKIKEMGYKDAFIAATKKDGTKISIQEAKELEKNRK